MKTLVTPVVLIEGQLGNLDSDSAIRLRVVFEYLASCRWLSADVGAYESHQASAIGRFRRPQASRAELY